MKKFELTSEFVKNALGTKVFRIKALVKFGDVSAGELGGYVEKEENLAQDGNAWVYGDADYSTVKGFGRFFRTTTFFRKKDKDIGVSCGCFCGTLDEFRDKVRETHGDSKTAKEYLMLADLMEYRFSRDGQKED